MLSIIVPISVKDFLNGVAWPLLDSLNLAMPYCPEEVEMIALINRPSTGRSEAKNIGAKAAHGNTLVFIDADCIVSPNFLKEISDKSKEKESIGGGCINIKYPRLSLGLRCFAIRWAIPCLVYGISLGAFWVRREDFLNMGGFVNTKYDDFDFAKRLKRYARSKGKRFDSIRKAFLIWSTRKFDVYGDWHWLKPKGYHTT